MSIQKSNRLIEIQESQGWTDETLLDLCLEWINSGPHSDYDMSFEDWLQLKADEENLECSPAYDDEDNTFIQVEYDTDYTGGNYSDVGNTMLIPADLVNKLGMDRAFKLTSNLDPIHIIHYNPDERYDENEDLVE